MVELPALVDAYWRHHALSSGERADRLAAQELFWAWEAVSEAMESDDPLRVLDALLEHPTSDPCYLGAGPVEDLLAVCPEVWDGPLAERCRLSERWRAVLSCVWLDDADRKRVPGLGQYLRPVG